MRHRNLRHLILGALIAAALATAGPAGAQDVRVGLGIGIQPTLLTDDFGALFAPRFYLPIQLGDRLIVEPSFGLFRVSQSATDGPFSYETSGQLLRLGVGLLVLGPAGQDGRVYFGPRAGMVRMASEYSSDGFSESQSRTDLVLAAVAGGEFFLLDRFSLGGEVGLEYVREGDESGSGASSVDSDGSMLRTTSELRVRWYLR
jgi:hypothetical protein